MTYPTSKSTDSIGVSSAQVTLVSSIITGVQITAAAADVTITIYNGTGTSDPVVFYHILDISVAGLSTYMELPNVRCNKGMFVAVAGTGAVCNIHYR